jgi:hypothetical protein
MRLVDLEPEFIKLESEETWRTISSTLVVDADGIIFKCPKCVSGAFARRVHSVICWKLHVPLTIHPKPGRWEFVGHSFYDLSLRASSSSVFLLGDCGAHFFIEQGEIKMISSLEGDMSDHS